MPEPVYPPPSKDLARKRRELAPDAQAAFEAFSRPCSKCTPLFVVSPIQRVCQSDLTRLVYTGVQFEASVRDGAADVSDPSCLVGALNRAKQTNVSWLPTFEGRCAIRAAEGKQL